MNKEKIMIKSLETLENLMQKFDNKNDKIFGNFTGVNNRYEAVEDYNGNFLFGLIYYYTGIKPKFIIENNEIFLGFDKEIICFSCEKKEVYRVIKLSSLFYDLFNIKGKKLILIICELDIYVINNGGLIVWEMGFKDLIVDFEILKNEKLKIITFDGDETIFLLENGKVL